MVLCFVALFVFAILGIFSAKYRSLTKEAFHCVVRTATLRPCDSNLDERIKSTVLASILKRSPKAAGWLNRNFQWISLAFTVLFFASLGYSIVSTYNYVQYGNCNGPESNGFCIFDVLDGGGKPLSIIAPGVGPTLGSGTITMVEAGCFTCPYTRATQPALKQFLAKHPEVKLEWRVMPIPSHADSFKAAEAGFCADEQGKFWPYYDASFAGKDHARETLISIAGQVGLDVPTFTQCLDSGKTAARVRTDAAAGKEHGIYGTPTFFINGTILVGPQSFAKFEDALAGRAANVTQTSGGACPPPIQ